MVKSERRKRALYMLRSLETLVERNQWPPQPHEGGPTPALKAIPFDISVETKGHDFVVRFAAYGIDADDPNVYEAIGRGRTLDTALYKAFQSFDRQSGETGPDSIDAWKTSRWRA